MPRMIRLVGGPADGCETPHRWRVMRVRIIDGQPAHRDGGLVVAPVLPSSASDVWVPYCYNDTTGDYRYTVWEPDRLPPWYDRIRADRLKP